jgi:hypothetical protein
MRQNRSIILPLNGHGDHRRSPARQCNPDTKNPASLSGVFANIPAGYAAGLR